MILKCEVVLNSLVLVKFSYFNCLSEKRKGSFWSVMLSNMDFASDWFVT